MHRVQGIDLESGTPPQELLLGNLTGHATASISTISTLGGCVVVVRVVRTRTTLEFPDQEQHTNIGFRIQGQSLTESGNPFQVYDGRILRTRQRVEQVFGRGRLPEVLLRPGQRRRCCRWRLSVRDSSSNSSIFLHYFLRLLFFLRRRLLVFLDLETAQPRLFA